ncbi:hypothetical protein CAC42_2563 [Sphaceloma murrayae]|uniref:Uncharacterized protein n=1 Tax=Sphaceloma murrayae TaxID=2082308 RepID=A0A2K1QWE9_9PEZI|nr:hypothetical protein CAC42_2563 [Sphaceloma murrayae]
MANTKIDGSRDEEAFTSFKQQVDDLVQEWASTGKDMEDKKLREWVTCEKIAILKARKEDNDKRARQAHRKIEILDKLLQEAKKAKEGLHGGYPQAAGGDMPDIGGIDLKDEASGTEGRTKNAQGSGILDELMAAMEDID